MVAEVAVYVQRGYAKPTYARETYNVRAWPGLEMVCDALRRAGIEVGYCSAATVGRYRVVLVSITSGCDWYPYVAERVRWARRPGEGHPSAVRRGGDLVVIVGGAGCLNVRPFLPYADVFCFGRAEGYVVPLVRAGLDGLSERLRRMVAKPITREMWRAFLRGLCTASVPRGKLKVYNLVGLPTERPEDWAEFMEDLRAADLERRRSDNRWGIVLHSTSFRAMPATPAATWPMSYHNYRGRVCRCLRAREHVGQLFYEGRNLWAVESLGTESLATHTTLRSGASLRSTSILDALALRGVESDAEAVARFACSRRFWTASVARRVAMLERYLDVARLFRGYTWGDLPTRYLRSYTGPEKIRRADDAARRHTGGLPWGAAILTGPPGGSP